MPVTNKPQNTTLPSSTEGEEFWQKHIQDYQASQLSRAAYCRLHQVNYDNFGYWLRKQSKQAGSLVAVQLKKEEFPVLCSIKLRSGQLLQIHDQGLLTLLLEKLV